MRISDWSSDVCSSDLFARDQRKIGGQADDDREARAARMFGVEAEPDLQPVADRLAEAGTRIGAGENADQRDADLHRRQEAAGVGGEPPCVRRAAAAAL